MKEAVTILQELERLPLLGAGRVRAAQLCGELAMLVGRTGDAQLEERMLRHSGELARVEHRPGAVEQLARAARLASLRGDRPAEVIGRLRVARALVENGRAATAERLLDEVEAEAQAMPAAQAELLMLQAALERGDLRALLERLLATLPSPARDHDRLQVLKDLAALFLAGGGEIRSREILAQALDLARRHDDPVAITELALSLGNLLLEAGLPQDAEPLLNEALDRAVRLEDTLVQVVAGSVLAALRLEQGDWAGAAEAAEIEQAAAARRHNWLALADATLTLSTCLLHADELEAAIEILVETGDGLRKEGAGAALNLVKARLGELRAMLGPETVDPFLHR